MNDHFLDRADAGKRLAARLMGYADNPDVIVLALPRGGVPVAAQIAHALHAPLDILVTRKIGAPFNPELALGAVSQNGQIVWNKDVMKSLHINPQDPAVQAIIDKEQQEAARRVQLYRADRPHIAVQDKIVILVDDGVATGATIRAAIATLRAWHARKVIVAVPVGPLEEIAELEQEADKCFCLASPHYFLGVGDFYDRFEQVSDQEVIALLNELQ